MRFARNTYRRFSKCSFLPCRLIATPTLLQTQPHSTMEGKLKALKVAELRELLQKASVPIPTKANKADLVAKILATPAAVELFNKQKGSDPIVAAAKPKILEVPQEDDLLAPPEEFDWNATPGGPKATSVAKPASAAPAPAKLVTEATPLATATQSIADQGTAANISTGTVGTKSAQDDELEKRKQRAARFGIPFTEPKQKPAPSAKDGSGAKAVNNGKPAPPQEQTKLDARAARFGLPKATAGTTIPAATSTNQKRKDAPAGVDQEELERRKRRAERFGAGAQKKA